jgi:hypothetical protein
LTPWSLSAAWCRPSWRPPPPSSVRADESREGWRRAGRAAQWGMREAAGPSAWCRAVPAALLRAPNHALLRVPC